ncbi:hypothetical protein AX15_000714 [Amanita polypyramis BW_CC]|nr:hypothetical protein AX15_000714 [Amanita polypyramis BW_CC]
MQDDYSDILGSGTLNVKPQSTVSFGVKAALTSFSLLVLYIIGTNIWRRFLKWRERSYRLAMRRKHGIPDDDHRPFNVAYAAVQRARQECEVLRSARSKPMNNVPREQPRPSAQPNHDLRQRAGISKNVEAAWMNDHDKVLPGGYHQSISQNITGSSRYNQNIDGQPTVSLNDEKVIYPRATELMSSANYLTTGPIRASKSSKSDTKKRNYVHMDIDEDSNVANILQGETSSAFKRGAKREFGDADETEDVLQSKRAREKRARKVSLEKELNDEEMEVDENELEDENDPGHISRGKKRDRAEAGSTFGGDDEEQSELGEIHEENVTQRRSRKRRSVVRKKSDLTISIRGKKRDRDIDDEPSDDGSDQGSNQSSSRKRRNKKGGRFGDFVDGDSLMDDSQAKGSSRKIGEEWTSNGVLFKIGPNGQRLRQALVKKARQKYSMPEDSQHPDRDANLEVYVEIWLTEDGYQDAKARHLLAWQDIPKSPVERGSHVEASQPPSPTGKSLLWKPTATTSTPEGGSPTSEVLPTPILKVKGKTRAVHDPRRHSVAVDVVTGVNPFEQNSSQANRRIASGLRISAISGASTPGLVDSTNSSPRSVHRIYSKWEKQDLEANAMMKMREAARKKEDEERELQEKRRQEKERAERERAEKAKAIASTVPSITVTKPPEDKPPQAENKVLDFFAKPVEAAKETPKPPAAATSPFSFSKPKEKTSTQTESGVPSFPAAAPSGVPFSFTKPSPNPFMPQAKAAEDNTKAHEQPKPSPFTMPQPSESVATGGFAATASSAPMFSLPKLPTAQEQTPEQSGQAGGPSLLSRLGGVVDRNDTNPVPPSTPSAFTFGKPSEAPRSFLSAPATTTQVPATQAQPVPLTTGSTAPSSTGSTVPLKFNFKVQNTKAAGAVPSGGQSSAAPTATSDSAKPTHSSSPFSFKVPTVLPSGGGTAGAGAGPAATADARTVPNFFGTTGSAFSGNGAPQAAKDANGGKGDNNKATFSFGKTNPLGGANAKSASTGFNNNSTTSNVNTRSTFTGFGINNNTTSNASTPGGESKKAVFSTFGSVQTPNSASDTSSKSSMFGPGLSSGTSAFGTNGMSVFGAKSTEPPKSTFGFGQGSVTGTKPVLATPTEAPKPTLSLGNNDAPKTTTTMTVAPNFVFGATNSLNKAGAAEGAATAVSNAPNPFLAHTTSGTGGSAFKFGSTSTLSAFGGGQPTFGSSSAQTPLGATGSGQPMLGSSSTPSFGTTGSGQTAFGPVGLIGQSTFGNSSSTKPNSVLGGMTSSSSNSQPVLDNRPSNSTNIFPFNNQHASDNSSSGQS